MQKWAKRGLQTAFVTGGMLMLGTGIAAADENVDPDRPVSPIDGSVTVPVDISNNAFGAPDGQHDAPEHQGVYSSRELTDPIKEQFEENLPEEDPFRGNRLNADVVVPVQVANNAVGLLGDAEVEGEDASQSYDGGSNIETDGGGETLSANVVDADWAAPVQIANNGLGVGGNASSSGNSAEQESSQGGNVASRGSDGVLSGNVGAVQGATPIQLNNNAGSVIGQGESTGNTSASETNSGGWIATHGHDGVLAGNVAAVPVAFPVEGNNGAYSLIGISDSAGNSNTADATSGGTRTGLNDIPSYAESNGDRGVASGNIVQPQAAGDGAVHGVAASGVGIANVGGDSASRAEGANTNETNSKAGAFSSSSATDSVLGGNFVDAPISAPVEAFCVAGSAAGTASSDCENTTTSDSGSGTWTNGDDATLGGNSVNAPLATTIETFGISGTAVGDADSTATEDKTVDAGGYNGTRGNDSTLSGNIVQSPVAAPVESFGAGGAIAGDSSASAEEVKTVNSGGDGNTVDDGGSGSSNVIATPIAQPVQLFGIAGAGGGSGSADGTADTTTTAGGTYTGTGKDGSLSGNVVQAASTAPAQVFGIGGGVGGDGDATGDNTSSSAAGGPTYSTGEGGQGSGNAVPVANALPVQLHGMAGGIAGEGHGAGTNVTDATAGGETITDGTDGQLAGNVVRVPNAGAASVFGNGVAALGQADGTGINDVVTSGGGDASTAGDSGQLAGNVISAQPAPVAQVFGDGLSVLGEAGGFGANTTDASSGGDLSTSGEDGSLAGNALDVPLGAVVQAFGDAATVGGEANGLGDNVTTAVTGGTVETSGDNSSLSGLEGQIPIGALVQIIEFEGPILGTALGEGTNSTDLAVGEEEPQVDLLLDGSEMAIDELPSLDGLAAAPAAPLRSERSARSATPDPLGVSPALQPQQVPSLSQVPALSMLEGQLPGLADLPALPSGLEDLPAAPGGLPAAPAVPALPGGLPATPADLPAAPAGLPALPDGLGDLTDLLGAGDLPAAPGGLGDLTDLLGAGDLPAAPGGLGDLTDLLGAGDLPALPTDPSWLPLIAVPLPAPAMPAGVPALPADPASLGRADLPLPAPAMPEMAQTMPATAVSDAGLAGMWARFVGFLTGRPMHIEG